MISTGATAHYRPNRPYLSSLSTLHSPPLYSSPYFPALPGPGSLSCLLLNESNPGQAMVVQRAELYLNLSYSYKYIMEGQMVNDN